MQTEPPTCYVEQPSTVQTQVHDDEVLVIAAGVVKTFKCWWTLWQEERGKVEIHNTHLWSAGKLRTNKIVLAFLFCETWNFKVNIKIVIDKKNMSQKKRKEQVQKKIKN